jgi:hypothetical protein
MPNADYLESLSVLIEDVVVHQDGDNDSNTKLNKLTNKTLIEKYEDNYASCKHKALDFVKKDVLNISLSKRDKQRAKEED